ncbi:tetratricopeptide repeat (TPR)-like superfamily protein isoform X4 [Carex rostrata]
MGDKTMNRSEDPGTTIYNVQAAELLAIEAQHLPILEAVPIYEKLVATFPTSSKYWKQYVEAYMAVNNDEAVKQIFSRCLLNCLHINLWRSYILFIRKVNEKKGSEGLEETRKAFDYMLHQVGSDIASGPVWMEYIAFLKSKPAASPQEESQRMTSMRKVYQKAILIPMHHLDQLWRDYEMFENSVSRTLAKGLLSEYQPKYNSAKAVYRERKKLIDDIDWNMLAVPPTGSAKEEEQCTAWKRLLAFEKGNPQRIDAVSANRRVTFTYEQALLYLYHYPEIWYDYVTWQSKSSPSDSSVNIFHRALKALPDSDILKYAFAELEESRGAMSVWNRFVQFEQRYGDLSSMLKVEQRRKEALSKAKIEDGSSSALENNLYDAVSRYSFLDLWPCSSKDLDHLSRQEWLANIGNKRAAEKPSLNNISGALDSLGTDSNSIGLATTNPNQYLSSTKVVRPDTSRMVVYDPRLSKGTEFAGAPNFNVSNLGVMPGSTNSAETDEFLKLCSPSLQAFITNLPPVEGVVPDVDLVLSILLQSSIPACRAASTSTQQVANPASISQNGSINRQGKRKDRERQDEDDMSTVQSRPLPRDVFKLRQIQKTRGATSSTQTGSAASGGGSVLSGGPSISSN